MRVAYVAGSRVPSRTANSVHVMKMCQGIVEAGHEVVLLVPGEASSAWAAPAVLAEAYGLRVDFPIERLHNAANPYRLAVAAARRAAALAPDAVYTRHIPSAAAVAVAGRLPVDLELHTPPAGMERHLYRVAARRVGRIVCITEALASHMSSWSETPTAKLLVAPDAVDVTAFDDAVADADGGARSPTVGYFGHLYEGRGVPLLLELAARLPDVSFVICGGEERDIEALRAAVVGRGLGNVDVRGHVPNPRMPRLMVGCDVLVLPYERTVRTSSGGEISRWMSPMKVFEYLAAGRPIVTSDLPVLREVLDDTTAVFVEPGDVDSWERELGALLVDAERRRAMGEAARQAARGRDWRDRAAAILGRPPAT